MVLKLRIEKITSFQHTSNNLFKLLIILVFQTLFSLHGFGQKIEITLHEKNVDVEKVMKTIEAKTNFTFLLNRELVNINFKIDIKGKFIDLNQLLSQIFKNTSISFTINDDQIILNAKKLSQISPINVSARVIDENSEPLIGVNVYIQSEKKGTFTDNEGYFTLTIQDLNSFIKFSYIGLKTIIISAKNINSQTIILYSESNSLNEVLSIGYGSLMKSDLTGSVSSVKVKNSEFSPVISVDQFLKGKSSGVYVNTTSAEPGGTSTVRVRGVNSLTADNEPLYVIDGMAMENVFGGGDPFTKTQQNTNPLAYLNPLDIQSVEVLKDASATAIYGSRGTNGVILISTKNGQKGNLKVNFTSSLTLSTIRKKIEMLSGPDYARYRNEVSLTDLDLLIYGNSVATKPDNLTWINWQDEVLQQSVSHNERISLSGGSDNSSFYLAIGNTDNQGIIKNTSFARNDFRFNYNYEVNKNMKFTFGVLASRIYDKLTQTTGNGTSTNFSAIRSMLSKTPIQTYVPYGTDADAKKDLPTSWINDYKDDNTETVLTARIGFAYQFTKNINYELKFGTNYKQGDRYRYYGRTLTLGNNMGTAGYSGLAYMGINIDNLIHFNFALNKYNLLNAVLGTTYSTNDYQTKTSTVSGFPDDLLSYHQYGSASIMGALNMDRFETKLISYIGRVNYNLLEKYLFTLSARLDGSSKFSEGHRYGLFPSAAVAWRVSEESFLKDVNLISNLKLRLGWGRTGNQGIRAYDTKSRYGYAYTVMYPFGGGAILGLPLSSLENSSLTWETSEQINAGVDIGLLKERISLSIDVYNKLNTNMLIRKDLPPSAGLINGKTIVNFGSLQNSGFDITLATVPLNGALKWTLDANISHYQNKIMNLGLPVTEYGYVQYFGSKVHDIGELLQPVNTFIQGQPAGLFFGYKTLGIFQNQAQIDAFTAKHTQQADLTKYYFNRAAKPGDVIYQDTNKDGKITTADYVIIGNPNPDFCWGINTALSYKQWGFEMSIIGVQGKDIFNANLNTEDVMNGGYANIRKDAWYARWRGEGTSNTYPQATSSLIYNVISDRLVEDASFARLSNLTLSYTFKFANKFVFKDLKLFASGNNLITLTNYRGFDPEVDSYGGSSNRFGIDNNSYPTSKSVIFGLSINL